MRLRTFALVLALLFAAAPALAVVCEMDCDPRPRASGCHESSTSTTTSALRGAQHACDHDHTSGSPAVVARANGRDSAATFVDLSAVVTPPHASTRDASVAAAGMHGPPRQGGPRPPTHTPVLRI